jgi:hypothetical protein
MAIILRNRRSPDVTSAAGSGTPSRTSGGRPEPPDQAGQRPRQAHELLGIVVVDVSTGVCTTLARSSSLRSEVNANAGTPFMTKTAWSPCIHGGPGTSDGSAASASAMTVSSSAPQPYVE